MMILNMAVTSILQVVVPRLKTSCHHRDHTSLSTSGALGDPTVPSPLTKPIWTVRGSLPSLAASDCAGQHEMTRYATCLSTMSLEEDAAAAVSRERYRDVSPSGYLERAPKWRR